MKKYQVVLQQDDVITKLYYIAKNKKEALSKVKRDKASKYQKIVSCYEVVCIQIEDIAKIGLSKACLNELKREGVEIGDIIYGTLNRKNRAVDFVSPKTGVDCMAWLNITCRIV